MSWKIKINFVFMFLLLISMSQAVTLTEYYAPVVSDLSVVQAVYSGQPIVCQSFNVTGDYTISQIGFPLKRQGTAVGDYTIRLYSNYGDSVFIPQDILSSQIYNDDGDFALSSSFAYYNFTIPSVNVNDSAVYHACIYHTNANNYIHLYLNASGGYNKGGYTYYTSSWKTDYFTTRDMPFLIYATDIEIPPSLTITGHNLIDNTIVDTYTTETIRVNVSIENTEILNGSCALSVDDTINQTLYYEDMTAQEFVFSYDYGFYYGNHTFSVECQTSEVMDSTGDYVYYIDTTRIILYQNILILAGITNAVNKGLEMIALTILVMGLYWISLDYARKRMLLPTLFVATASLPLDFILFANILETYPVVNEWYSIAYVLLFFFIPFKLLSIGAVFNRQSSYNI